MNIIPEFIDAFEKLGWDPEDDIALEIGGTSVYEIEGAGTKWAPVKGPVNITKMHHCNQKPLTKSNCPLY